MIQFKTGNKCGETGKYLKQVLPDQVTLCYYAPALLPRVHFNHHILTKEPKMNVKISHPEAIVDISVSLLLTVILVATPVISLIVSL